MSLVRAMSPARVVDHVYLVGDDEADPVDPSASVPDEGVGLLGRGYDDIGIGHPPVLPVQVPGAHVDLEAHGIGESLEIVPLLGGESLQWYDVKDLPALLREHLQSGDHPDEGLPARGRYGGDQVPSFEGDWNRFRLGRMELPESCGHQQIRYGVRDVQFVDPHDLCNRRGSYLFAGSEAVGAAIARRAMILHILRSSIPYL